MCPTKLLVAILTVLALSGSLERGAPKGQGLHRPQNGCDSAGSLPHRMLIGLEDDKSSALRPGRFL